MAIGETVLGAVLQVVFDRLASKQVLDLFKSSKLDQSLVEKLKHQMNAAGKVLADADQKQISDSNVKSWLSDLQHLFYRAEEIAEKIATEALRSSMDQSSEPKSFGAKVRRLVPAFNSSSSFATSISSEINEVITQLEDMLRLPAVLNLRDVSADTTFTRMPTTYLLLEDTQVFGRDQEEKELFKSLFSEEAERNRISIVAIVGMGGMGKTTLAKHVYNHENLKPFDLKTWVYVSDQFDIFRVTKSILENITCQSYSSSLDLNFLQHELSGKLRDKKFFLVLDDVWNKEYEEWECLRAPLTVGAHGSKIIVTTRNVEVASIMRTTPVVHLKPLSDEDGWSLFSKHAFALENFQSNPRIEIIGRKIVHNCQGLPLAIKAIGGLLRSKEDIKEWEAIWQSTMWELLAKKSNVAPALMLSYHHLPSHLKQCFSYCAISPKGYKFDRKTLVLLWMAENFVKPSDDGRRIEDVGEDYLNQLLSRSFFDGWGNFVVMHDLMHDLAEAVSGEFVARQEHRDKAPQITKKVRYFSFSQEVFENSSRFEGFHEAKYLRTFIPLWIECKLSNKIRAVLVPKFNCLHVLSLSRYDVLNLPESIGNLMQLRYLDVSETLIKELPETVSTLCNLQTLLLSKCYRLERLPKHLSRLVSLRHLDISNTKSLDQMPKHISELNCLQTLSGFVVSKDCGHGIEELKDLLHIRGKLALRRLQNVSSPIDAFKANLSCKRYIKQLALEFDDKDNDDSEKGRLVLENLKPHTNLERLTILNYFGTQFPSWLINTQWYENLVNLYLKGCKYCWCLPPLGQLPSLSSLEIVGMDYIMVIGPEFYTNGSSLVSPFPVLRSLLFNKMKNWKDWLGHDIEGRLPFPCLKRLSLLNCPELEGHLPVNVLSLKELLIEGCESLESSVFMEKRTLGNPSQLASITNLRLVGLEQLMSLPPEVSMLSYLETLYLTNCENLKSLDNMALPCNLRYLDIQGCKILESLPKEMVLLNRLLEFHIRGCPCLKSAPEDTLPTSLQSLYVNSCERWEFPIPPERMKCYSALEFLKIKGFIGGPFISFPLGAFPKLRTLLLQDIRDLETVYIPRGSDLMNLISLEQLFFTRCPKLKWIGKTEEEGVLDLPAPNLQRLEIRGCNIVKPLVSGHGEGLPSKLQRLDIDYHNMITLHRNSRNLLMFSCLRKLHIYCHHGDYFPDDEVSLPISINKLWLTGFPNLKNLNGEALKTLSSLQTLRIVKCPNLQCLPEEGLPLSLGCLEIWKCPMLGERCRENKGLDWPKIHHIPRVQINNKRVIL